MRVFGGSSAHWRPRNFVFFVFLVSRVLRLKNPSVFSVHFPLLFFLDTTSHWLLRPGRAFSISAGSLQGTGGPAAEKLLAVCRNCICCICSSPGVFAPSCFAKHVDFLQFCRNVLTSPSRRVLRRSTLFKLLLLLHFPTSSVVAPAFVCVVSRFFLFRAAFFPF